MSNKILEIKDKNATNLYALFQMDGSDEVLPSVLCAILELTFVELYEDKTKWLAYRPEIFPELVLSKSIVQYDSVESVLDYQGKNSKICIIMFLNGIFLPAAPHEFHNRGIYLMSVRNRMQIPFAQYPKDVANKYLSSCMKAIDKLLLY